MSALLAISISHAITKYGAYAGFASIVGLAVLSLLYFSQAREVKRLREWAGRAPERAAEIEQRVSVEAAARVRPAPPAPARPVVAPRAVSAVPPSRVAGAAQPVTAAAGPVSPATAPTTPPGTPGVPQPAVPAVAAAGATQAPAADPAPTTPSATPPAPGAPVVATTPDAPAPDVAPAPADVEPAKPLAPIAAELESAESAGESDSAAEERAVAATNGDHSVDEEVEPAIAAAAPATAAAAARAAGARSPLPPAPATGTAEPAGAGTLPPPPRVIRRPDVPAGQPPRRPSVGRSAGAAARLEELGTRPEGSSSGARVAIGAIVGVAVLVLVVLFFVLRGGGSHTPTPTTAATPPGGGATSASTHASAAPPSNPATLAVAVINGTSVNELAHHLATDLTQNGYNQATPLSVSPGGTTATTTVYYVTGHKADARGVAQVLGVNATAPMTTAIRSISGTSPIVVVAGTDQSSAASGATGGSGTGSAG